MSNQAGIINVRFQPYRLFRSECYSGDARISCVACHDPHQNPRQDAAFYDARCLACHATKGSGAPAQATKSAAAPCPMGAKECVTCHMPKVSIPGSHFDFTDHWIRIVKPGAPFPN
jgi:formate-dependent nitrite reductase cytochrome c552 subunit